MKFKHCLMLSAFFASLLIAALLLSSKSMSALPGNEAVAATKNSSSRMIFIPARHTLRQHVMFHHSL